MQRVRMARAIAMARAIEVQGLAFNMSEWITDPFDCCAAACVGGYMMRDAWMNAEGLHHFGHDELVPIYRGVPGIAGLAHFLDIDQGEAMHVFFASSYLPLEDKEVTAGMVADRLQHLLDREVLRDGLPPSLSSIGLAWRRPNAGQKNSSAAEATERATGMAA